MRRLWTTSIAASAIASPMTVELLVDAVTADMRENEEEEEEDSELRQRGDAAAGRVCLRKEVENGE